MIECISTSWSPGIGDPTFLGWATVGLYLIAGIITYLRARDEFGAPPLHGGGLGGFWVVVSGLMFLMAVNKQLDLQSALTAAGRCLALDEGWYGERRAVQVAFIAAIGVGGISLFGLTAWILRRRLRSLWLVLTGLFSLVVFVLLRASSFEHMDAFIKFRLLGIKMNWFFEIGSLVLIIAGARRRRFVEGRPVDGAGRLRGAS